MMIMVVGGIRGRSYFARCLHIRIDVWAPAPGVSSAKAPEKTVRINITARDSQIEMIDWLAREAAITRSSYTVQSAMLGL
jgi:hypothetical protein